MREILSQPEILPCAFDPNMEFWIERVALWGTPIITHYKADSKRGEKITKKRFLDLISDATALNVFGKWDVDKLNIRTVKFHREYYGYDNKLHKEAIIVQIDLKPELKKALGWLWWTF